MKQVFCHFYGKSDVTSWRYVHVDVMPHININKYKMVEQRLVVDIEVHVFS